MNKKNVLRIALGVALLLVVLLLFSCGAQQPTTKTNRLVGKWYTENNTDVYFTTSAFNNSSGWYIRVLEFYENGKFIALTRDSYSGSTWVTYPGTYVICDDETLILYSVSDETLKFKISGNTLQMWNYKDQAYKDYIKSSHEITAVQFKKQ